jgi:cell wall assembly regulator SMI1
MIITIQLTDHFFQINNVEFSFPIEIERLKNILGDCRHNELKYNTIYTWDELGLIAGSKNGKLAETLYLTFTFAAENYVFSPKQIFGGALLINEEDALTYYAANKNKRIKLFKEDRGGAIALNGMCYWFNVDKNQIQGVEISEYAAPEQTVLPARLEVDQAFKPFKSIWQEWNTAVVKAVGEDNAYYNLTHGITEQDLQPCKNDSDFKMPVALLNFYKIHNVDYNSVTSAFSFSINGWQYDLIPFAKIKTDWEGIQDLNDGGSDIDFSTFSDKVKATDYANPAWVPFAEGRNGDYLLYDTDPSGKGIFGQIIELQNESWVRNIVAASLEVLLINEIELIKTGKKDFTFIIDN